MIIDNPMNMMKSGIIWTLECIWWKLSWETTPVIDHLSWKAKYSWQKGSMFQCYWTCHRRASVFWETTFLWPVGWSSKTGSTVERLEEQGTETGELGRRNSVPLASNEVPVPWKHRATLEGCDHPRPRPLTGCPVVRLASGPMVMKEEAGLEREGLACGPYGGPPLVYLHTG